MVLNETEYLKKSKKQACRGLKKRRDMRLKRRKIENDYIL